MRTRIVEWLDQRITASGANVRNRIFVRYGVDVFHNGEWHHACEGKKALIFDTKERAEAERAKLRRTKPEIG